MADLSSLSGPVGVPLRPPSAVPTRNPPPASDAPSVSMPAVQPVSTVVPLTQDATRATFFSHAASHPRPSSAMPRTSAPILSNFSQSSFTRTLSTVASSLQLGASSKATLPPPSHGSPGPSALLSVAKARLTARPQSSQSNATSSPASPAPLQSPLHARPASSQSTRMLPLGAAAPAGLEIVTYLPTVHHAPTPSLSPTSTSLIASPPRVATDAPQLSPQPLSPVDLSASPTFTANSDHAAEPETSIEPVEPIASVEPSVSANAEPSMVMTPQALLSLSTLRAPLDTTGNFNLLSKSNSMAGLMSPPPRPSSALPRSLSHSSSATILSNNMLSVQRGGNLNYSFAAASPARPLTAAVALSTAADVLQLRQELKSIQNAGAETPATVAVRAPLLSPQSRTNTAEVSRFLAARGTATPTKSMSRNSSTPLLKTNVSPPVSRIVSLHDTSAKLNEILVLAAERSDSPPVQPEMFVFQTTAKAEAEAAAALARLAPWERSAIRLSASPVNSPSSVVAGISSPSASAATRGFVTREVVPFASTQSVPAPSRFDVLQKHYHDGINRILAPPPPAPVVTPASLTLVVAVAADTPMMDDAEATVPESMVPEVIAPAASAEVAAMPAEDKTSAVEAQISISKSEFELTVDSLSQLASLLEAGHCAPKDAGRLLKAISQRMASHNST